MVSEKEKMLRGLAHQPYTDELVAMRLRAKELLYQFNILTRPSDKAEKVRLILALFGKADATTHVNAPFYCDYGSNIKVGKNFFANYHCTILDNAPVTIGDDVMFAPNVSLYAVGHPLDPELRLAGWEQALPITIGNNVWLGGNVVVLGGVTIGDNVVIAAGSLVTKDIPANTVAVGSPCRVVRQVNVADRENYLRTYRPQI
ncbi:sugar O-acetyltransferase [Aggregatibacter actinomycetemcomitans]|uniref:sugar O-acetyltransferase n=1 Tax=Aggregatibacter actinomycetemcomitans TaxID=714 RepID=UPI00077E5A73|nr:sugar O-acetyltransferase [Aggregatibacter actinomycetemcomitans]KYK76310.1 galactoside O-acetyltransferase [Aggregatibacter actinomycetemcomitans serotype e str. SA3096]KYK95829.1 galactoside O-acetyltransferase [Aggregatibacter actinomycetemcomitans serotype e str. ANH9776]TYB21242.1 sugar O-acetyltransferase [Aggregatibacter actinomycetemcomitans]